MRPVLSVSSFGTSDKFGDYGVRISITDNGAPIRTVTVQCVTNKVVFAEKFTLELERYALIDEYSVSDVKPGESFTADCLFGWAMWMKSSGGFFALGGITPGIPTLGIGFYITNGIPSLMVTGGSPRAVTSDLVGLSNYRVTGIDGSLIVRYSWAWSWFRQEKTIHVIGATTNKGVEWRVGPKSEPIIRDGRMPGGFKVTAKGPEKGFGVTFTNAE
jgi:hypothetical protein